MCNTHCFSTATIIARTRLNVTLYGIACLVFLLKLNENFMYRRVWHKKKRWVSTIQCIYAFHTILTSNNHRVPTDNDRTFFLIETLTFFVRYKRNFIYIYILLSVFNWLKWHPQQTLLTAGNMTYWYTQKHGTPQDNLRVLLVGFDLAIPRIKAESAIVLDWPRLPRSTVFFSTASLPTL